MSDTAAKMILRAQVCRSIANMLPALEQEDWRAAGFVGYRLDQTTIDGLRNRADDLERQADGMSYLCPNCDGQKVFRDYDSAGNYIDRPCGFCDGLGRLPREAPDDAQKEAREG